MIDTQRVKLCFKCNKEMPLDLFEGLKIKGKQYTRGSCRICENKRKNDYDKANPIQHLARSKKWKNKTKYNLKNGMKKRYGISYETFLSMMEKQNGVCAICNEPIIIGGHKRNTACIDHNHQTGKIRELLCANCNNGIGHLKENITTMYRAIEYIKKHTIT